MIPIDRANRLANAVLQEIRPAIVRLALNEIRQAEDETIARSVREVKAQEPLNEDEADLIEAIAEAVGDLKHGAV
jgi:hypothetical protein